MLRFLKENWLWIVLPFLLVVAGLVAIAMMTEGDATDDFIYNL